MTLAAIVLTLFPFIKAVAGELFQYGNLEYEVISETDHTCRVYYCSANVSGEMIIPSTVQNYRVVEIAPDAFSGCKRITSVTIPVSVERIGLNAFSNCTGLERVLFNAEHCANFDDGISPFINSHVKEFVFGPEVHYIPDSIASHSYYLETVTIGENVDTIGATPFLDCPSITTVNYNATNAFYISPGSDYDSSTATKYLFSKSDINAINFGENVNTIPKWFACFLNHLTNVVIPDKVQSLDQYTFVDCLSIKSITLGASMKSYIGFYFPSQDYKLEPPTLEHIYISNDNPYITIVDDVIYNKDLTAIYYYANYRPNDVYDVPTTIKTLLPITFRPTTNLRVVNISHDVEFQHLYEPYIIGPFYQCAGLAEINVTNHSKFASVRGVLYTKDLKTLVFFPPGYRSTTFTIPSTVEEIAGYSMRDSKNLEKLVIPDNVKAMGEISLGYAASLTTVTIGNGLKVIPRSCFSNCKKLTSVNLSNQLQLISANAFQNCSALAEISLPASLKSIGNRAFQGTALQSVNLPEGLISISRQAFNQTKLEGADIPQSVIYVGQDAFSNTPWINNNWSNTIVSNHVLVHMLSDNVTTIPNGIRCIAGGALSSGNNISQLWLPGTIESIGTNAFKTNSTWYNNLADGITYLDNTLYLAKNLPNSTVTVREGTKCIAGKAFNQARTVTNVTLPSSLITIGEDAFTSTNIESIIIPEGVRYIGYDAFRACDNMKSVYMPSSVEVIDDYAFETGSSPSLKEFHCAATTPPLLSECTFYYAASYGDVRKNCTLYVPKASIDLYKKTDGWKQFKFILPDDEPLVAGDVTGDSKVDVEDVNAIINIILEIKNADEFPGGADITGDGKVDVEDVNAAINTILKS